MKSKEAYDLTFYENERTYSLDKDTCKLIFDRFFVPEIQKACKLGKHTCWFPKHLSLKLWWYDYKLRGSKSLSRYITEQGYTIWYDAFKGVVTWKQYVSR